MADGCVERHTALIYDRGGVRRVAQLVRVGKVEWERTLSVISGATLTIYGQACIDQLNVLRDIRSHRHEIRIYRGDARSWEGVIQQIAWKPGRVEITARDVVQYVEGSTLSKAWPNADGGGPVLMTDRIDEILSYELETPYDMIVGTGGAAHTVTVDRWENIDPPANVLPYLNVIPSATLLTRSSTLAFEMTVGEHLRALAEGGLDFTAIGRSILVWDSATPLGRTRVLTEADFFGELEVFETGAEHAAIAHVSAQRDEEEDPAAPSVGSAGEVDPYYGPWTYIVTRSDEEGADTPTQDELNTQAQRAVRQRRSVPLEIVVPADAGIRLGSNLTIDQLVPGTIMPVRATMNLREVSQDQLLTRVHVTETADGETISVSLTPAGEATI